MKKLSPAFFVFGTLILSLGFLGFIIYAQSGKLTAREENMVSLAQKIGLDEAEFTKLFQGEDLRDSVIERDRVSKEEKGITGTPTLTINDKVTNSRTKETLEAEIDAIRTTDPNATVVIREYFDFQCGHCRDFHANFLEIKKSLKDKASFEEIPLFLQIFNVEKGKIYSYAFETAKKMGKSDQMAVEIYYSQHGETYPYESNLKLVGSSI